MQIALLIFLVLSGSVVLTESHHGDGPKAVFLASLSALTIIEVVERILSVL